MFVLRAMFWIGAVAVLAPHPAGAQADTAPAQMIENFRAATLAGLARVKAEFAAEDRAQRKTREDSV
jgi:hypothetical protein